MDNSNDTHNSKHSALRSYRVTITEKHIACGEDSFISYGMKIKMSNGTTDEYEDIAFTKIKINELYSMLTENDIDESHIYDIICDFVDSLHCI